MRLLIFALSLFITTKNVVCLDCFATDIKGLKSGHRMQAVVENCDYNIKKLLEMQGKSASALPSDLEYACYKVVASSSTEPVEVKGCIPKGGCDLMKSVFEFMFKSRHVSSFNVDCYECQGNRCNSAEKTQVFAFVAFILAFVAFVF